MSKATTTTQASASAAATADRMKMMERELDEAAQTGANTLVELEDQRHTLEAAHRRAIVVESEAAHAEALTRSMDSFFSRVYYAVFGTPKVKTDDQAAEAAAKAVKPAGAPGGARASPAAAPPSSSAAAAKRGEPSKAVLVEGDAEVSASLDRMSDTLAALKGLATGMGDSIDDSGARIDAIHGTLDRTEKHFAVVDKKTKSLIAGAS